jgi:hypothetical protein
MVNVKTTKQTALHEPDVSANVTAFEQIGFTADLFLLQDALQR